VGDHWAAGETLERLVVRIGEMLAFQSYNVKSPLNGEAARWVAEHGDKVPLDDYDFSALLERVDRVAGSLEGAAGETEACANCGKILPRSDLEVCAARHPLCKDCRVACASCGRSA